MWTGPTPVRAAQLTARSVELQELRRRRVKRAKETWHESTKEEEKRSTKKTESKGASWSRLHRRRQEATQAAATHECLLDRLHTGTKSKPLKKKMRLTKERRCEWQTSQQLLLDPCASAQGGILPRALVLFVSMMSCSFSALSDVPALRRATLLQVQGATQAEAHVLQVPLIMYVTEGRQRL